MIKIPMSRAASGLLRALLDRGEADRNRILLSEIRSREWQSLTFAGERHSVCLRILGPNTGPIVRALTCGIDEADFSIPGQIVADIVVGETLPAADGSVTITIEALTIVE